MSEKVIREFQVIETDEGFRIEIKGDKEELRPLISRLSGWGFGFGGFGWRGHGPHGSEGHEHPLHMPFGRAMRELRKARHGQGHRFGGRWEAQWGYDMGPWWDESDAPDAPHEDAETDA